MVSPPLSRLVSPDSQACRAIALEESAWRGLRGPPGAQGSGLVVPRWELGKPCGSPRLRGGSVHGNHGIVQRKLEQVMLLLDLYPVPHCSTILPDWLVAWNMFFSPYIGNNHLNWLKFWMSLVMFLLDLHFSAISSGHQGFHHQIGDPPSRPTILPRKSPVVNE